MLGLGDFLDDRNILKSNMFVKILMIGSVVQDFYCIILEIFQKVNYFIQFLVFVWL